MQYRGFEIQNADFGYIIRNSNGGFITMTDNDAEAKEYIDDMNKEEASTTTATAATAYKVDYYKVFSKYCEGKLPGKCYPTDSGEFGTTNLAKLNEFIKSFEKSTQTKVVFRSRYIGGELFYIVENVFKD